MKRQFTGIKIVVLLLSVLLLTVLAGCGGSSSSSSSSSLSDSGDYQVSGILSAKANFAFDSDINDENADYCANDSFDEAQEIDSEATVSGYVNVASSGELGRSYSSGDTSDFYKVELESGQQIALSFNEGSGLSLYLYQSDQSLEDSATGTDSATLVTNSDDTYYIEVKASSGASVYSLIIGEIIGDSSSSTAGLREMHLSDSFVPGDVIVRFTDDNVQGISAAGVSSSSLPQRANQIGLQGYGGASGRAMRMGFNSDFQRNQAFEKLGIQNDDPTVSFSSVSNDQSDKLATIKIVQALRLRDDVAEADLNYYRSLSAYTKTPDDNYYTTDQTWHYELINLPEAWAVTDESALVSYSDPVIVAVIDTGVLLDHPDLDGRVGDGYDFISTSTDSDSTELGGSLDGDGLDNDPDDPGEQSQSVDGKTYSLFHGSHVAGTIAAESNNIQGVAGVTWSGCSIMPLRVLGYGGSGTSYDIIQALRYAAGYTNDSGTVPDQTADIINLSLGGDDYLQSEQDLYTEIYDDGIIVVAAAGNASSDVIYPAAYDDVVAVSAVGNTGELASYSNYGDEIDVAAPGGDVPDDSGDDSDYYFVYSTIGNDLDYDRDDEEFYTYKGSIGTSMATPHVAGVAALIKREYPDLTAEDFDALLQSGELTDSTICSDSDECGYGLIDAYKAVTWATSDDDVPTVMETDPATLSFDDNTTSESIEVTTSDGSAIGTVEMTADVDWLSVTEDAVATASIVYTVTTDTSDMYSGEYNATLTFESNDSDITGVEVSVTLNLESALWDIDGGLFYIQLYNTSSGDLAYETSGTLSGGVLNFDLFAIEADSYDAIVGTDVDNDGDINETNEIGSGSQVLTVGNDLGDVEFELSLISD
jgi:serine protease